MSRIFLQSFKFKKLFYLYNNTKNIFRSDSFFVGFFICILLHPYPLQVISWLNLCMPTLTFFLLNYWHTYLKLICRICCFKNKTFLMENQKQLIYHCFVLQTNIALLCNFVGILLEQLFLLPVTRYNFTLINNNLYRSSAVK